MDIGIRFGGCEVLHLCWEGLVGSLVLKKSLGTQMEWIEWRLILWINRDT